MFGLVGKYSGADGGAAAVGEEARAGEGGGETGSGGEDFDTGDEGFFADGEIDAGDLVMLDDDLAGLGPAEVGAGGGPDAEDGEEGGRGSEAEGGGETGGGFHGNRVTPRGVCAYCMERLAVMRMAHNHRRIVNLDLIRSFFAIVEQGSLNKAAERLRVSQSTLTRQMQTLEQDVGGPLLERSPGGVALTATGHALIEGVRPVMEKFDAVLADVRQRARGQSAALRVGYLMSAASDYLNPALAVLRKVHPEVKVKMIDLSPGEQIAALRKGEIDVGLIGQTGALLTKEFYVKKLAALPVMVALAADHPLAAADSVKLGDLKKEVFVGAPDADVPGHNQWVAQLCKRAGFRARFVQDAESLTHGLSLIVTEGAVSLQPGYAKKLQVPGVVFRPLRDSSAKWELMVAWQRGKVSEPVKALLDALPVKKM